jgi:hypothetical protein
LSIGSSRFKAALAVVPPFDELAAFSVGFIVAVDADVISAHAAFAVEKSAGVSASIVDFDLLEESYVWRFGHLGGSSENRQEDRL